MVLIDCAIAFFFWAKRSNNYCSGSWEAKTKNKHTKLKIMDFKSILRWSDDSDSTQYSHIREWNSGIVAMWI